MGLDGALAVEAEPFDGGPTFLDVEVVAALFGSDARCSVTATLDAGVSVSVSSPSPAFGVEEECWASIVVAAFGTARAGSNGSMLAIIRTPECGEG